MPGPSGSMPRVPWSGRCADPRRQTAAKASLAGSRAPESGSSLLSLTYVGHVVLCGQRRSYLLSRNCDAVMPAMPQREDSVVAGAVEPSALLSLPEGRVRAGVVLLHPADDGSRRQFLFEHLAQILPAHGVAVVRYDRRRMDDGRDVPYQLQVDDLNQARETLVRATGPVPVGLWGFSQGAWVALLSAATDPAVAFLVLVGCSAVSPALQMRYGTAVQLRSAGFGEVDLAELDQLRSAWEQHQRGQLSRDQAQLLVDRYRSRPWFSLGCVPAILPGNKIWDDMDFDPALVISRLASPVLAFYGHDEWIPVKDSINLWRRYFPDAAGLDIRELAGTTHYPTLGGGRDIASISPDYTATLIRWLERF